MATSTKKNWAALTWDDLEEWANRRTVSRGQSYQRGHHVINLVVSPEGRLLANVSGGSLYVVSVWLEAEKQDDFIQSECTCPVGIACKHAVAVVAEYLDMVAKNKTVPSSTPDDPRWNKLANQGSAISGDDEEMDDADEDDEEPEPMLRQASRRNSQHKLDEKIERHIRAKGQEELADLVWSLTQRFPELRSEFRERIDLSEGKVDHLIKEARRELERVTAEPGWANSWSGGGYTPDYSQLIHRLERLLLAGHADAVVRLGKEIIERGNQQVEQSNDEGETGNAFAECLPVIFKAVSASSLSPAKKLLFVVDATLEDGFDQIGDAADAVEEENSDPAAWSEVADELAQRLTAATTKGTTRHRDYQRDRLSNWLGDALLNANRREEVLKLYEQEARKNDSYDRLVKFLIRRKCYDEALQWAKEGIEKTAEKLPGIASSLADCLRDVARARRRWDEIAAHEAWRFFENPSREGFEKLMDAAAKAGCQGKVRECALHFLETGVSPLSQTSLPPTGNHDAAKWPLLTLDYLRPLIASEKRYRKDGPHYGVLIDMAIAAKRPDEVLHWYDTLCASRQNGDPNAMWTPRGACSDLVAAAVVDSHPQRSLEIYRQHVKNNLGHASKSSYEVVVSYLRKMGPIFKTLDREDEWKKLITDIRSRYHNRPRFMEMLNRLDEGTIVQSQMRMRR